MSAARVRDLQTKMMVGALQCRGTASEVLPAFNRFVSGARGTIAAQNALLRAHFVAENGAKAGAAAFDRFTTALANGHSQTAGTADFCPSMAAMAADAEAAGSSLAALDAIALRLGEQPRGVSQPCKIQGIMTRVTTATTTVTRAAVPEALDPPAARMTLTSARAPRN